MANLSEYSNALDKIKPINEFMFKTGININDNNEELYKLLSDSIVPSIICSVSRQVEPLVVTINKCNSLFTQQFGGDIEIMNTPITKIPLFNGLNNFNCNNLFALLILSKGIGTFDLYSSLNSNWYRLVVFTNDDLLFAEMHDISDHKNVINSFFKPKIQ